MDARAVLIGYPGGSCGSCMQDRVLQGESYFTNATEGWGASCTGWGPPRGTLEEIDRKKIRPGGPG